LYRIRRKRLRLAAETIMTALATGVRFVVEGEFPQRARQV